MTEKYIFLPEIAYEQRLSLRYVQQAWRKLFPQLKPQKAFVNQRKIKFLRSEYYRLAEQPK